MAESFEFDPDDPEQLAGLAKIEEGIMQVSQALYSDDIENMMPICWAVGVELIGYSREGHRVRRIETLMPVGQGFSATRGILENAAEGAADAFFNGTEDE
ncbi:hypothetical protein SEA_GENAMY16_93 [Gordonia phage Genamy16]|uniref:Uncharacterized protein n=2 Tax=Lambovirus TaxID=2843412 RepID=A0A9E7Q6Z1_9CAUD|nr:hypothetical protein SEA_GENAMY16_93 [Gordonia phage Genamy16]UVF61795.1 hypothetical protein SEA_NOVASHARKS_92 [Gordonia phage NovaSharks]UVK63172.1 hypothetical protein SEA_RUMI_91 [Gordonia phage Rumi]WNM65395.1 hypothetical protein SEA_ALYSSAMIRACLE_93 [Gordonia phage Alyssamiracle]